MNQALWRKRERLAPICVNTQIRTRHVGPVDLPSCGCPAGWLARRPRSWNRNACPNDVIARSTVRFNKSRFLLGGRDHFIGRGQTCTPDACKRRRDYRRPPTTRGASRRRSRGITIQGYPSITESNLKWRWNLKESFERNVCDERHPDEEASADTEYFVLLGYIIFPLL